MRLALSSSTAASQRVTAAVMASAAGSNTAPPAPSASRPASAAASRYGCHHASPSPARGIVSSLQARSSMAVNCARETVSPGRKVLSG